MKKSVSVILMTALLVGLNSCSGASTAVETVSSDTVPTETAKAYPDDLPENLDYDGEKVTYLYRNEIANEFYVDSETGDVVDDAIYRSFRQVEERLNVDVEVVLRDGHYTQNRDEYMNHIRSTVAAGDDVYDWVDLMIGNAPGMLVEGLFLNIADNRYIDYDKPWYISDMMGTSSIDGKLYFVSGDASLGYIKDGFCIYFNSRLIDDYHLENPYELVDAGKWTYDKLMEMSEAASSDVNGDGVYDLEDKLGFIDHDTNHNNGYIAASGMIPFVVNKNGEREFVFGSERDADVCNKIYQLYKNTAGVYKSGVTDARVEMLEKFNAITAKFAGGEALFTTAEMDDAVMYLRDMKDSYGILPYPKFDENQDSYYSSARNTHNSFSLLTTCGDADMAGAVHEALSSSNYSTVLPAYYEVALKTKYSRDNDSARMYDLIRDQMVLDFGYTYNNSIGGYTLIRNCFNSENNMASTLASTKGSVETKLATYIEKFRTMEN